MDVDLSFCACKKGLGHFIQYYKDGSDYCELNEQLTATEVSSFYAGLRFYFTQILFSGTRNERGITAANA